MFLLLGVASGLESFVAKLPGPEPVAPVDDIAPEIDELLALVLGLVSLDATMQKIKQAALASKPKRQPQVEGERIRLTELLR